jgi:hypothetical protein
MSRKNVTKVVWYILVQLSSLNSTMPMVSGVRGQRPDVRCQMSENREPQNIE